MPPRFFAPDAGRQRSTADLALSEEEPRHATSVLRLRPGDEVAVFDGRGGEWLARITTTSKSAVHLVLGEAIRSAAEPRVALTLLQAVLKGDHMDVVVRDATMLGVARIIPILTTHTAANPGAAAGARVRGRWVRVAIASAKQCRRAVVPEIASAVPLESALAAAATTRSDVRIVLAEPTARSGEWGTPSGSPRSATLAVGPEGGWARDELERFRAAGFVPLTLGSLTLRADAASMVAIGALRERWGDW